MSERSYLRFYYAEFIRDYPDIYSDDAAFATWMRLLTTAEAMWPGSPELPRSVRSKPLAKLVDRGLVIVSGFTYRMKGLDAERTQRAESARKGAAVRWQSERNANAYANAMPKRDETRRDESSSARTSSDDDPPWLTAWFATGRHRLPTPGQQGVIDGYLRAFDVTGPDRLSRLFLSHPDNPIGAAKDDLAEHRAAARTRAVEAEAESAARRKPRGLTGVNAELAAFLRQKDGVPQ